MNYELAKQLKKAEFPYLPEHERRGVYLMQNWLADSVYEPTLEELIEACGTRFYALTQEANGTWRAEHTRRSCEVGSTPTEAVARLWLALNKKTTE